jgi:hypothetical protein
MCFERHATLLKRRYRHLIFFTPKKFYEYGSMFTNHRFNEFTILEYQANAGWNSGHGLTISAPAKSRAEALKLSNQLMKPYLNGHLLK